MDSTIIILVALAAIAWLAFIVGTSVSGRGREQTPANVSQFKTDDELETTRLDRNLATAVVFSAFLALAIPIYWLGEQDRQDGFVVEFAEESVARGEVRYGSSDPVLSARCVSCHGVGGVGGSAPFVETRSGTQVSWAAPSLNDVFFRYDEDEVRFWITFGRPNTPMPAWGLEGGGPLSEQAIQDIINYLRTIQLTQEEALAKIEPAVGLALQTIENGPQIIDAAIADQDTQLEIIDRAPQAAAAVAPLAEQAREVLDHAEEGVDSDADGLSDVSEQEITRLSSQVPVVLTFLSEEARSALGVSAIPVELDPLNPESIPGILDRLSATSSVAATEALARNLSVTAELQDQLRMGAEEGRAFLVASGQFELWRPDFGQIADSSFGGAVSEAERAVGLFNAYCARCHTSGSSAGLPYTMELASGGLGPALFEGRVNVQFQLPLPLGDDTDELVEFIKNGSLAGQGYGVNGVGTGRMPGWGMVLSEENISYIARMLRGLGRDA